MARVPFHAVDSYLARLVRKGEKRRDLRAAGGSGDLKGTPGAPVVRNRHARHRDGHRAAGGAAGHPGRRSGGPRAPASGSPWLDLAAGRFTVLQGEGRQALAASSSAEARELLLAEARASSPSRERARRCGCARRWQFELASASRLLTDQLGTLDLKGFGADDLPLAIRAAGALLQYVRDTQKSALPHIRALHVEERSEALTLDAASRRNLELDVSLSGAKRRRCSPSSTAASPPWAHGSCAAGSTAR